MHKLCRMLIGLAVALSLSAEEDISAMHIRPLTSQASSSGALSAKNKLRHNVFHAL